MTVVAAGQFLIQTDALAQATGRDLNQGPKAEAVGEQVMVSTQLPVTTDAAIRVLQDGGNAIDALITAVFLQHVADYHQNSLFGAASGIYYEAATDTYYAFNGFSDRPLADRCNPGMTNGVAIGGTVRSMEDLWKRFGTRPWKYYFEPAIAAAQEGVEVTSFMYGANYATLEGGGLFANQEMREFYMPDGHLVPVGQLWKMPSLASSLRKIAETGADYMYTGKWGQQFVEDATSRGYCVTMEDMAEYEMRWLDPIRFNYRGHEIIMEPPPVSGGVLVGSMLNIVENFDLKRSGHFSASPETLELMARAFGRVEADVFNNVQDPLAFQNPIDIWLSEEYAKLGAEIVRQMRRHPGISLAPGFDEASPRQRTDREHSHAAIDRSEVYRANNPVGTSGGAPPIGSNHNVIVDAEGNWVTMLHTGHGGAEGMFIKGVAAGGSRIAAETRGPGRRVVAWVAAAMVAKDGKPWLALGTPGTPHQPVAQVLINLLDFDMSPGEAADAPRFWAFRDSTDPRIEIESRLSYQLRQGMRESGITIKDMGDYNWRFGSMQIVWIDPETGRLHGVTDPRRLGKADGY